MLVVVLYGLIYNYFLQGSLYTSFSTVSYYKNIDTLRELVDSKLPVGVASASLTNFFGDTEYSPLWQALKKQFIVVDDNPINRAANKRDICSVERKSDVQIIIRVIYK